MNSKIALILAIILGAFAAITVKFYISKVEQSARDKNSLRQILVAKTSLKANQLIKDTDIGIKLIENDLFDKQNMFSNEEINSIINKQIYYDVSMGFALMKAHFEPHGNSGSDGSMLVDIQTASAKLKPYERAVTIKVDGLTGVAMLLKPGEFIDIYWTGQATVEMSNFLGIKNDGTQNLEKITTMLLSDVQIMALDNRYNLVATVAKNRLVNVKENYGSITVRCRSYEEAKLLIHAQTAGKLTMAKKGEDQNVVENDEALDLLQMLKLSRKVNAIRKKDKDRAIK